MKKKIKNFILFVFPVVLFIACNRNGESNNTNGVTDLPIESEDTKIGKVNLLLKISYMFIYVYLFFGHFKKVINKSLYFFKEHSSKLKPDLYNILLNFNLSNN